jgi:hypothetical protein
MAVVVAENHDVNNRDCRPLAIIFAACSVVSSGLAAATGSSLIVAARLGSLRCCLSKVFIRSLKLTSLSVNFKIIKWNSDDRLLI